MAKKIYRTIGIDVINDHKKKTVSGQNYVFHGLVTNPLSSRTLYCD